MAGNLNDPKPRVMTDANILIAGTVWPRFPYEVMQHALNGTIQLVLCPFIITEVRNTLRRKFPAFAHSFEAFLQLRIYEEVPNPSFDEIEQHPALVRDKKDIPIALAAIRAHVDYFISEDKDFTSTGETTAPLHQQLRVLLPGAFLREVMGWTSDQLAAIQKRQWGDLTEE